ncbi:MAG: hypothetical protein GY765_02775 [bacterium]|nr:hypothetical protein [bacterium]
MKKFVKFSEVRKHRTYESKLEKNGMSELKGGTADVAISVISKRCPYIGLRYGICPALDPNTRYGICQYNYQCQPALRYGISILPDISDISVK